MREHWSRVGFILAGIGSAVGLGNIWRFPYIVGEGGGGAFLIPYLFAVLFFGIPVMMMELAAGRKFKGSVMTAFKKIHPKFKYLSFFPLIVVLVILSYYLVITGFTLAYFLFSFSGYPEFSSFTNSIQPLFFFLASVALIAVIVSFGIKKGVENACKVLLPALAILILILVFKSFSMPGFSEGMAFYLRSDMSAIMNIDVWILAFGQAFFSLSAGSTILLTYGSYLSKESKISENAFIISAADVLIALTAGVIIFPMVFSFGHAPNMGVGLAFVIFPEIFSSMHFGFLFGAFFFFILFAAAITSAISMFEVGVTTLIDEAKFSRKKSVFVSMLAVALAGIPSALSYSGFEINLLNAPFLDSVDFIFGSLLLLLVAAFLCLVISWFTDTDMLLYEINKNSWFKMPKFFIHLIKFVIPFVLIFVFVSRLL